MLIHKLYFNSIDFYLTWKISEYVLLLMVQISNCIQIIKELTFKNINKIYNLPHHCLSYCIIHEQKLILHTH